MSTNRINRDDLFMELALSFSKRSTCMRGQVGGVLVRRDHVIAHGYNGSPKRLPHCSEVGCDVQDPADGCQRAIHCEANIIAYAAKVGVSTDEAVLYNTHAPCKKCAELIASAGIVDVFYIYPYRLRDGLELLNKLSVVTYRMDEPIS